MIHPASRAFLAAALLLSATTAQELQAPDAAQLALRCGQFDPLISEPAFPDSLRGEGVVGLHVVQFHGVPTEEGRAAVRALGAELHGYLPHNAYVARMSGALATEVGRLPAVRFVGAYRPAWRLEKELVAEHLAGAIVPERDYHIVVVDKRSDKPGLATAIELLGGEVVNRQEGSLLFTVRLDGDELIAAAHLDSVLWIERVTPTGLDMDNARIQGGADYIEGLYGYTGQGVRGHVYEGVEAGHRDFTTPMTNVLSGGAAQSHGHCTAGIVFGNGSSNPAVRGMAPDAVGYYTTYNSVTQSRNAVIGVLVNTHEVMFTTASWGDARTRAYTAVSADADDIIFDHRMPWTQSQSNSGNQDSRPQAWAKNIFSIGGVAHRDNSDPSDDSWAAGGASTGPAADGRIKPDLCAYYDNIGCSDLSGSAGYSSSDWMPNFGGTSGATPIVAGHNAITIQMFAAGALGNTPRVPGGTTFQNRPLAQTLKAIQIANAQQYPFQASSSDNRRQHQGWGFPSLRNMYENSNAMLIVAEDDVVTQGTTRSRQVSVLPNEGELKVCMTFVEPAANPTATQTAINDLTLKVTAPDGTVYWGNVGLTNGNYSAAGGAASTIDPVECVFVRDPAVGTWTIDVIATRVVQDAHVATPAVDATYALCAVGVDRSGALARFTTFGDGCGPVSNNTLPATFYELFGSFDLANRALRFTPNAAGRWAVADCPSCFDTNFGTNLGLSDDMLSGAQGLGFAFPLMGGGTTTAINVDSNGWIGLVAGQHTRSDYTESAAEFVGGPARIAAFWDDLNPSSGGAVYFNATAGKATITWLAVPEYPTTGANTAQIQLFPNGEVVLAWQAVSAGDGLVGYSVGQTSDPGPSDISNPSGGASIRLGLSGAPRLGTTVTVRLDDLPATAAAAVVNLGLARQAIDLTSLGLPGCTLLTTLDSTLPTTVQLPAATAPMNIPNLPALLGAALQVQGVVVAPGVNAAGVLLSNGGTLVFGS